MTRQAAERCLADGGPNLERAKELQGRVLLRLYRAGITPVDDVARAARRGLTLWAAVGVKRKVSVRP